jgi:hypothetical protein|tara:strand:- start:10562 stop:10708 length:147 start_codon:yes stop_codon:yes gene_type:complete
LVFLPKKIFRGEKMGHCDGCGADFEDGTEHNCGGSDESQDEGSQDENQ